MLNITITCAAQQHAELPPSLLLLLLLLLLLQGLSCQLHRFCPAAWVHEAVMW
jgi:hypothetical protein